MDFSQFQFGRVSNDMFKLHGLAFSKGPDRLFEYKAALRTRVTEGPEFRILTKDSQNKQNLLDSLDRVGGFDLVSDFLPSTSTGSEISDLLNQIGSSKGTDEQGWAEWFLRVVNAVQAKTTARLVVLVPDTNFIMRHYCSNILLPLLGQENFSKLRFQLPRLVILEIEAKCNRAKEGSSKKRLAFHGAREVLFLLQGFASHFPQFDMDLLRGFPKKSGEGFADSWIRQEIHDFVSTSNKKVIFLTADLMNALAATAEGLDVFYVKKDVPVKPIRNIDQLAEFIIDVAVAFEEIKMDVTVGNEMKSSWLMEGMWSGKTSSDWQNDCIRMSHARA